jgi:hypothetical protein
MVIRSKGVDPLELTADSADDQNDQERNHGTDDSPETPLDEPRPPGFRIRHPSLTRRVPT